MRVPFRRFAVLAVAAVLCLAVAGYALATGLSVTSQVNCAGATIVQESVTLGGNAQKLTSRFPANMYSFSNGTSTGGTVSGVVDLTWSKASVTLASSASVTYTLSGVTDDLGRTIAFARIRVWIQVTSRTGNDYLTVGAAGTHPFTAPFSGTTPAILVRDLFHQIDDSPAALVVTSGSADQLKITNSGSASVTFTIWAQGNST